MSFPLDEIHAVYCSEIHRPGYVLNGPKRSLPAPVEAKTDGPLTATLRERELHRVAVEHRRPRR